MCVPAGAEWGVDTASDGRRHDASEVLRHLLRSGPLKNGFIWQLSIVQTIHCLAQWSRCDQASMTRGATAGAEVRRALIAPVNAELARVWIGLMITRESEAH